MAAFLDNYYALLSGMPERNKMAELLVSKLADFLCHYAACCQPDVLAHVDAITYVLLLC